VDAQEGETQRAPDVAAAQPSTQSDAAPGAGAGVLLSLWNAGEQRREIRFVDPDTGQDVPGHPPIVLGTDVEFGGTSALSPDGRKLAVSAPTGRSCEPFAGGTSCRGNAGVLHLIDPQTGHATSATLPSAGWLGPLAFSPDATRLALVYNEGRVSTLMLVDTDAGEIVTQRALESGLRPSLLSYAHGGTALAVYATPLGTDPGMTRPGPPRLLLVDTATLAVRWEHVLADVLSGGWCLESCTVSHERMLFASWTPAVVLSHDKRRLYVVHADDERLTTVDLDGQSVRTAEIRTARSWLERLIGLTAAVAHAKGGVEGAFKAAALSADGARLYVLGRTTASERNAQGTWEIQETPLGLQVLDAHSGRKLSSRDVEATDTWTTPDGTRLVLLGWANQQRWTEVLDPETLQSVARLTGWHVVAAYRTDGRPIVLATQPGRQSTAMAVLDSASFQVLRSWSVDEQASWVTPS
jgi:hypothetical protein